MPTKKPTMKDALAVAAVLRRADAMRAALTELRAAADACAAAGQQTAVGHICSAVANLIAGSGDFGGTEQLNTMDLTRDAGFLPMFYAGSIRVEYRVAIDPPDFTADTPEGPAEARRQGAGCWLLSTPWGDSQFHGTKAQARAELRRAISDAGKNA